MGSKLEHVFGLAIGVFAVFMFGGMLIEGYRRTILKIHPEHGIFGQSTASYEWFLGHYPLGIAFLVGSIAITAYAIYKLRQQ